MATGQTHGGKGSTTRPTDKKKYEDNWDAIFGKKHNKELNEKIDELFDEKKEKEELYNAVNEVLKKEKLKEKSVDFSDLCAVREIMDAAKVPPKIRGEKLKGESDEHSK